MKFIHRANVPGRVKTALFAGLVFWAAMTLLMPAYFLLMKEAPVPRDFLVVPAVNLVAAILFGAAMSLRHPMIPRPGAGFDDEGEGLGVTARLIPPSPVLGARAFPESHREEA